MNKKIFTKLYLIFFITVLIFPTVIFPTTFLNAQSEKSMLLMDADTGVIYWNDNIDQQRGIASLTKLMTVYVALDEIKEKNLKVSDTLEVSERAAMLKNESPDISGVYLTAGDRLSIDQLLNLALVYSDNGAAVVLGEDLSGSEQKHVAKMNEKAKALGMKKTQFYNASGLTMYNYGDIQVPGTKSTDYNKSTARDMGVLVYNLLRDYPKILDYTSKTKITYKGYDYNTYNQMLPDQLQEYPGVRGLKTGTEKESGDCFIGYYTNNDKNYVSIVLGANSDVEDRFVLTGEMYDWIGEQNLLGLFTADNPMIEQKIRGSSVKKVSLYPQKDIDILGDENLYLILRSKVYNPDYFDENGLLKKTIPEGATVMSLDFDIPKDNDSLNTVFRTDKEFQINLVAHQKIVKNNKITNIISSVEIFFEEFYNSIF